jgi:hypothetical protein
MITLLWFLLCILSAIPAVTCLVYYHRRLGARRTLLKETLTSMSLHEDYMRMRHPECANGKDEFDTYFDNDFRAGLSAIDYWWPVGLVTILSLVGWFLAFSRIENDKSLFPPMFAFGFVGAFLASLLNMFDDFRTLNLDPSAYYGIAGRLLFSSTAAYLAVPQTGPALIAVGIGLIPVEDVRNFVINRTSQLAGTAAAEGERGLALNVIQGLEDRQTRKQLVDLNIATVQALATSDPFWLFFQTTLPLRSIVDIIDKAILYLYIGESAKELRKHGVNGIIELVALAKLADKQPAYDLGAEEESAIGAFFQAVDTAKLMQAVGTILKQEPEELRSFIYNCYFDPQVSLVYEIWGKYYNPKTAKTKVNGTPPAPEEKPAALAASIRP